jgi:hypothetical protein
VSKDVPPFRHDACSPKSVKAEFGDICLLFPPSAVVVFADYVLMTNDASGNQRRIPTVSRVCEDRTVIELLYDPHKRTTALAVSRFNGLWNIEQEVRVETGETLVPYAPTNNLITNECVLLPSKPVDFGFKHELIADIRAFLHRYFDLSPVFEQIAAHYVLLTWVHDRFGELPYLRLRGDFGTGKTRGLLTIGSLCYRPFFASGASTVSPIFHVLDAFGGTLILDEADLPFSDARAEIVKILNNGTVAGMPVLRCVPNRHKEYNPRAFKVFGPKIIAMRQSFDDTALESRFLTEETGARRLRTDIPIQLPPELKTDALELRNRLLHFRLAHLFDIKTDISALMPEVEPRLNQTALSLLSLIDEPDVRRAVQEALIREYDARLADRSETPEARVLAAAMETFGRVSGANIALSAVATTFNERHSQDYGRVSNKWIGYMVRKRLHLETQRTGGVYVIPLTERTKISALSSRYGITQEGATVD